jgi:hypothetical protein
MRLRPMLSFALVLSGCCTHPWEKFPMTTAPDRSCRTGSPSGYDVYLWSCTNNQHVVVYQFSAENSCQQPQKDTAACGEMTPIETTLGAAVAAGCRPVPESLKWP